MEGTVCTHQTFQRVKTSGWGVALMIENDPAGRKIKLPARPPKLWVRYSTPFGSEATYFAGISGIIHKKYLTWQKCPIVVSGQWLTVISRRMRRPVGPAVNNHARKGLDPRFRNYQSAEGTTVGRRMKRSW